MNTTFNSTILAALGLIGGACIGSPLARAVGWGLPWLVLLAISASAAYGMTAAVSGADADAARGEAVTTAIDEPVASSDQRCDTTSFWIRQNAISNDWLPAGSGSACHLNQDGRRVK